MLEPIAIEVFQLPKTNKDWNSNIDLIHSVCMYTKQSGNPLMNRFLYKIIFLKQSGKFSIWNSGEWSASNFTSQM